MIGQTDRHIHKGTQIDREKGTYIHTYIHTDRGTYIKTDTHTNRHTDSHIERQRETHTYRQTDRQSHRETERGTYIHTDSHTERQRRMEDNSPLAWRRQQPSVCLYWLLMMTQMLQLQPRDIHRQHPPLRCNTVECSAM